MPQQTMSQTQTVKDALTAGDGVVRLAPNWAPRTFLRPGGSESEMRYSGYLEKWVVYSTGYYSAKEATVFPNRSVTIRDAAAYGTIVVQGWGTIGKTEIETPSLIRSAEMTKDEIFVTADAAKSALAITNRSDSENLVMLKHFGPGNPDAEPLTARST